MAAPLFCMMTPVTQYLKGLFNLHKPLITKSIILFMLLSAFSLLYIALFYFCAFYYLIPNKLLTASSIILITYYDMNYFYIEKYVHRLNPSYLVRF